MLSHSNVPVVVEVNFSTCTAVCGCAVMISCETSGQGSRLIVTRTRELATSAHGSISSMYDIEWILPWGRVLATTYLHTTALSGHGLVCGNGRQTSHLWHVAVP